MIVRKLIGAIRDSTSDIRHPTSEIRHPTSDIRDLTSEIWHPTSNIRHPRSDIRHPTSEIRHPTSDIRYPISEIRHPTFEKMAVMCSAWDQGTYEVRFERKQCGLFWFCLIFLSFCIVHCSQDWNIKYASILQKFCVLIGYRCVQDGHASHSRRSTFQLLRNLGYVYTAPFRCCVQSEAPSPYENLNA